MITKNKPQANKTETSNAVAQKPVIKLSASQLIRLTSGRSVNLKSALLKAKTL